MPGLASLDLATENVLRPILFIYRKSDDNIGDQLACPLQYFRRSFPLAKTVEVHLDDHRLPARFRNRVLERIRDQAAGVVVGGGGLLGNDYFRDDLFFWSQGRVPTILWGAGHNSHDVHAAADYVPDEAAYDQLLPFSAIGLRDWGPGFTWVPCASCMHPILDDPRHSRRSGGTLFVVHRDLRNNEEAIRRLLVRAPDNHLVVFNDQRKEDILEAIGRSAQVISNSFHALYWATLMQKQAVAIGGGTKVRLLKHGVPVASADTWPEAIGGARIYPEALDECRDRNADFSRHVLRTVIGRQSRLRRQPMVQDPIKERELDFRAVKAVLPRCPERRVPRLIHFIFGLAPDFGGKPFNIMHYVAIRSVADRFRPDEIQFHYCFEPQNEFFERVRPLVTMKRVVLPTEYKGAVLTHFAHRSDVLRLMILNQIGGIYLDLDTITVRSLDPILDCEFTIGLQGRPRTQGLCNAVMAAAPGSTFGASWLERYATFSKERWDQYSVRLPYLLWRSGKHAANVENSDRFHWPTWEDDGLKQMFEEDHDFPAALVHHLWDSQAFPRYFSRGDDYEAAARRVQSRPSTYARLARPYLET